LSEIKIFDPACGSGNFLTESFISLRRIENQILKLLFGSQIQLGELINPIKVSISQFYGVEINDFAVAVAQTALWIAELQMIHETQEIIHRDLDFLPLKSYSNIVEGNSLQIDWQKVCPQPNYIIGNPPFVGARIKSAAQTNDIKKIFAGWKNFGNLDYVCCWYKKAADFARDKDFRAAFVSTNSICQGDSVATLWKPLFDDVHIDFAYRTFRWDSESAQKAHVHCVIVGFSSAPNSKTKIIFDGDKKICAANINAYLLDAPNIFVESRPNPLQDFVPPIGIGNKPIDDGNYLFTFEEMTEFIAREPLAEKYFRKWYGAREFINNEPRWCLLLKDCPPNELKRMPTVYQRVKNVREFRLSSKSAGTRKLADKPTRFHVENFPTGNYLAIPKTSSEKRFYIPIGFLNDSVICADSLRLVPNATLYHFGVLTSSIHMAWVRTVSGRMKSDYSYSNNVVYNNFVWQRPTPAQISAIEHSAQNILDVRAKYSDATFAELYDEVSMPYDLRAAHKKNDLAVARAYGWEKFLDDEPKIAVELLKLYKNLAES
ncbi:MAG: class I SAM-dependent DNA methyltransferase, partial [Selenomonadaceae bacterium]|nr:class I SAM-dependent DNA methyltransferase [Selenomonadaceae bacterium]